MIDLKSYFHEKYQGGESFIENVILPIFGEDKYEDAYEEDVLENNPELTAMATSIGISRVLRLGTILIPMNPTDVFDITVNNRVRMGRNRVAIQQLVRRIMSTYSSAFMIFHYENDTRWDWRFTFCGKRGNNDDMTDSKRFTYLLGPGQSCRTAAENFTKLLNKKEDIELKDIESAFDVEALSNEFFEKYKRHYERFVEFITGKRFVKQGGKWAEEKIHEPHPEMYPAFGEDDKRVRDYVKKLLGRIVFLHFLQKKGWLGVPADKEWGEGDKQFMKHLFEYATEAQKNNFLDVVLEPLFADGLDKPCADDRFDTKVNLPDGAVVKMPYLNGGLFERDMLDEIPTRFPSEFFGDLLEFLYQYNFTIDENDPSDAEVGVDPEMLGRIFENLLEDNKDKGTFYTPKEIVRYMCRESLVAYLTTRSVESGNTHPRQEVETAIRKLLLTPEEIVPKMTERHKTEFGEALREVRICDPAIGSGAFPMGLLSELVRLRVSIGAWAKDANGHLLTDDYAALKCEIIRDNIYGVDIERGAIDIARLRFWLSIVVDEHEPRPLPNLDYKFMQGNSLITTFAGEYVNLDTKDQKHINVQRMDEEKRHLFELKKQYFSAAGTSKYQLEIAIKDSILRLVSLQLDYELRTWYDKHIGQAELFGNEEGKFTYKENTKELPADKQRVIEIGKAIRDRLADTTKPPQERAQTDIRFFDWRIMFTEVFSRPSGRDGFDIVIGNPPYVQLQSNGGELARQFENCHFETFARTGDIYCLFYEKGWQLLNQKGDLCFITSNKWMRAGYGEKTRAFFAQNTNPKLLIDFAGTKIFDSATVDTNILLFGKEENAHQTICAITDKQDKSCLDKLSLFVRRHHSVCSFSGSDSWVILSPIEQSIKRKIEAVGTPLKDWDINIYRGVLTGYNDAFIISTEKRDEILANCQDEDERSRTAALIRPILRGRDIKRYGYEWAGLYLIATFPSRHYDIEQYPAVKQHLLSFGKERLEQTGKTYTIKGQKVKARRKASNKWFETQDSISFWEDFYKPKIIYPNMTKYMPFVYDDNAYFTNQKCFIITGKSITYLTAFFNSSLFKFCFRESFPELQGGTREMSKIFFDKIPVMQVTDEMNDFFKTAITKLQSDYTKEQAIAIDNLLFDLYNLTKEERELIGYIEIK